jgi:hypothetical protein
MQNAIKLEYISNLITSIFFYVNNSSFCFHWHLFFYFISNNNCRLLTINIVSFIFFCYRESKPPFCLHYEKSSPVISTLTFVIYRHPVTLFTKDADWHKLVTDLFYDFVSILLAWVAKCKMPSNWKISVNIVSFIFFYYRESKPPFVYITKKIVRWTSSIEN